ncbi:MAG: hypothetical protein ABIH66_08560 [bacterium]
MEIYSWREVAISAKSEGNIHYCISFDIGALYNTSINHAKCVECKGEDNAMIELLFMIIGTLFGGVFGFFIGKEIVVAFKHHILSVYVGFFVGLNAGGTFAFALVLILLHFLFQVTTYHNFFTFAVSIGSLTGGALGGIDGARKNRANKKEGDEANKRRQSEDDMKRANGLRLMYGSPNDDDKVG